MLQGFGLAYEPDPRVGPLFEDLSISVLPGECAVLTGPNGAGKSKLMQILAGQLAPTRGKVVLRDGTTVGYLPQDFDFGFEGTLWDLLGVEGAQRLLARLGIGPEMLEQPYQTLSLGERTRANLARILLDDPDILLLDEPTNHLDIDGRLWLERTLGACRQGILMVCHDRAMANAVATRMLELDRGALHEYTGNFDDMVRNKSAAKDRQRDEYDRQRAEAKRLLSAAEDTMRRAAKVGGKPSNGSYEPMKVPFYRAKAAKLDKRAKAIRMRVEHAQQIQVDKPYDEKPTELAFSAAPLRSGVPLIVRHLRKSYERPVLTGLSLTLERKGRVAVLGPNGSGKTTLFRILLGEEAFDAGEIVWSPDAKVGFLSQDRGQLNPGKSLIDALDPQGAREETLVRTLLARLQIRRDDVYKPVGALSVGERTKAELVKMLMSPANVLIMDEPTNHLDVPSLEALELALHEFPGSVIFTSHDRAFVESVSTDRVELSAK